MSLGYQIQVAINSKDSIKMKGDAPPNLPIYLLSSLSWLTLLRLIEGQVLQMSKGEQKS